MAWVDDAHGRAFTGDQGRQGLEHRMARLKQGRTEGLVPIIDNLNVA